MDTSSIDRRYQFGMAVVHDSIYVCGGLSNTGAVQNTCEQFTASSSSSGDGSWLFMDALLPIGTYDLAMAAVADQLFVIGGVGASTTAHRIQQRVSQQSNCHNCRQIC